MQYSVLWVPLAVTAVYAHRVQFVARNSDRNKRNAININSRQNRIKRAWQSICIVGMEKTRCDALALLKIAFKLWIFRWIFSIVEKLNCNCTLKSYECHIALHEMLIRWLFVFVVPCDVVDTFRVCEKTATKYQNEMYSQMASETNDAANRIRRNSVKWIDN